MDTCTGAALWFHRDALPEGAVRAEMINSKLINSEKVKRNNKGINEKLSNPIYIMNILLLKHL